MLTYMVRVGDRNLPVPYLWGYDAHSHAEMACLLYSHNEMRKQMETERMDARNLSPKVMADFDMLHIDSCCLLSTDGVRIVDCST